VGFLWETPFGIPSCGDSVGNFDPAEGSIYVHRCEVMCLYARLFGGAEDGLHMAGDGSFTGGTIMLAMRKTP
jgi:hypothetical protein